MDSDLHSWSGFRKPGRAGAGTLFALVLLCWPRLLVCAPTAYGERFIRLEQAAAPTVDAPARIASAAAASGGKAEYERQLVEMEHRGGPYAASLAEPLAGLARLQEQRGDLVQSRRLYERALHLVRVNEGLYSERQIPILRQLFASYRQTGDMQTLDARYNYYFRLYGAGQPPYTPLRLGATLEYLRWQREALLLDLDGENSGRLLALLNLNERLLEAVSGDEAVAYPLYRKLALSQLHNLYLLQHMYRPDLQSSNDPPQNMTAGAWERQESNEYRLDILQRNAIPAGRKLLEAVIAKTPHDQPVELAANYLELGDWHQWNDRRADADAAYRQVIDLLGDSNQQTLLAQWLHAPQELPANGVFQLRRAVTEKSPATVRASFDVSARGRAKNIEASREDTEDEGGVGRFRRELAATRFRPAYPEGQADDIEGLSRQYELLK